MHATGFVEGDLYAILGVERVCSLDELRSAYRRRAREFHPDVAAVADGGAAMAKVNAAWRVLSDPDQRDAYDRSLGSGIDLRAEPVPPSTQMRSPGFGAGRVSRRQAWVRGIQAQIIRLSRLAGRSAAQTLLLRSTRVSRATYETLVEQIVASLIDDTEARVRAARAAGAAPLDLGVAATLIGLRSLADQLRRQSTLGITHDMVMTAELIDRMWDILAHELPQQLTVALGGNPRVGQVLGRRR